MHNKPAAPTLRLVGTNDHDCDDTRADRPAFQPTIHFDDIFREMIRAEIRNGRLSAWRRRRIVQYAAQLKLSAVEAGRLIAECRDEISVAHDPSAEQTVRLLEEPVADRSFIWNIGFILVGLTLIFIAVARR